MIWIDRKRLKAAGKSTQRQRMAADLALSHSIARGVIAGLAGRRAVFHVTRKRPVGRARAWDARPGRRPGAFASVREAKALLAGLLACIAAIGVHTAAAAGERSTSGASATKGSATRMSPAASSTTW